MSEKTENVTGVQHVFSKMADNTAMHGLPNIKNRKSTAKRIFWLLVILAALALLIWQITSLVIKYFTYPVSTTTEIVYTPLMTFPAITICNLNAVKASAEDVPAKFKNLLKKEPPSRPTRPGSNQQPSGGSPGGTQNNGPTTTDPNIGNNGPTTTASPNGGTTQEPQQNTTGTSQQAATQRSFMEERDDFKLAEELHYTFMTMDEEGRMNAGHSLDDMLLDCSWKGMTCTPENFTKFSNWNHGNCYTFNSGLDPATMKPNSIQGVDTPGALEGLMLKLYVQSNEYVSALNAPIGIRMVVHNQSNVPFPETEGILIQSGSYTQIGIRTTYISREDPPHGYCSNFSVEDAKLKTAYMKSHPGTEYTRQGCINTCLQQLIMKNCNCSSYMFPSQGEAFGDMNGTDISPCDYDTEDHGECIEAQIRHNSMYCMMSDVCPDRCIDYQYTLSSTVAKWPTNEQATRLMDELADLASEMGNSKLTGFINEAKKNPGAQDAFIGQNVLTVRVFLEDLSYISYTTQSSFGVDDFLSALGGTGGLWLGISVVTIFELIEVLLDIFAICCGARTSEEEDKTSDPI